MNNFYKLSTAIAAVSATPAQEDQIPSMIQFLDDMETHYKGEGAQYNRVFLKDLTECLGKWDDDELLKS